ncbi:MAG: RDD family protein [Frankiales bacterium]|nr:RDD family protein [Frankiales bacterium]
MTDPSPVHGPQHPVPHLNPIPPKARVFQGLRAGVVSRTAAGAIDYLLVASTTVGTYLAIVVLKFLVDPRDYVLPTWSFGLFLLVGFGYLVIYLALAFATTGRTVGARLMGLRVVGRKGTRMHWWAAVLRAGFCAVFPVGLFWCAVSRENRSVQDVVLRTSVIHDWPVHAAPPSPTDTESRSQL